MEKNFLKKSHIGLVAGDKNLPVVLVEFCKKNKIPLSVVGIKGSVSSKLLKIVNPENFKEIFISQLSTTIDFFKKQGVDTVVIVGGVNTAKFKFTYDLFCMAFRLLFMKNKYDGVLRLVISEFEKSGFKVVGIQDVMPELLAKKGVMTDVLPSAINMSDVKFGLPEAVNFALTDKGQSIIVKDGKVIATEKFSGTDELISRASKLPNSKGAILVKVIKPQQEIRADIPVLGVDTIKSLAKAKFDGVVIQSGKTVIENASEVISTANKLNIFILVV
ncbi:MAG: UDP-2,3-diacylglucosamine diphosphatase LpxI [bacterium]|nr:UDP-2,3-diacylglucosamine diphosphatase LpxI [bacterium]